jgi:hypothetical protein
MPFVYYYEKLILPEPLVIVATLLVPTVVVEPTSPAPKVIVNAFGNIRITAPEPPTAPPAAPPPVLAVPFAFP